MNKLKIAFVLMATAATTGFAMPTPVAAPLPAAPAVCITCQEGCTSGKACRAYEKCENGGCVATVQTINCEM